MNYIVVIVTVLAIGASCIAIAGRSGVRLGFLLWIGTLALGYRTVTLTEGFKLHPSAISLVGVFLWLVLTASSRVRTVWWTPIWLWALVPFWWWGWIVGLRADAAWDEMLSELQSFVLFIPLFVVAATVLEKRQEWKTVVLVFYGTATFVAIMGLAEYFYPGIRGLFPGFVSNAEPYLSPDGFERAQFSFWGHQAATFICALAIPFLIPISSWSMRPIGQLFARLALGPLLAAVYVSGFRVLWLFVVLQFILWLLFKRRYVLGILAAGGVTAGYAALPDATQLRIESFLVALQGTPVDGSSVEHLTRASDAVQSIQDYPFGLGWTVSGWVHSDFLQVAANLGIVPGVIFAGAYLWTAIGLWKLASARRSPDYPLHLALLLSFLTAGGIMCTQVVCVLPQLACPIWFVWALVAVALRQHNLNKEEKNSAGTRIRFASHIQLREYSSGYPGVR